MEEKLCAELPAQPVWVRGGGENNEYADFCPDVKLVPGRPYTMRIAADTDYNVFLGGRLVGFGQYSSYPSDLVYDEIPLRPASADEELIVTAWHSGVDSSVHIKHRAYAVFCVFDGEHCIFASGPRTPSRFTHGYVQHGRTEITGQLGPGFDLDGVRGPDPLRFSEAVDIGKVTVRPRPNRRLVLEDAVEGRSVRFGTYRLRGGDDTGSLMTEAELDVPLDQADGRYYLVDLGRETVGFPEIEFCANTAGTALVGWGEHLKDGLCRVCAGWRRFAFSARFCAGRNRFFPALRRIGCRYIQVFIPGLPSDVRVRFRPSVYPVEEKPNPFSGLRAEIYSTAVHTLRCCMHEHYEDCPWREQALYTLDSRNQMLAGYEVFSDGNVAMARASLDLISRGVRPDGMLSLCYPAGRDLPIPFYTLAYFIQLNEYVRATGDVGFAVEKLPVLSGLMDTVLGRRAADGEFRGLVPRWPSGGRLFWNFYEWSPGMDGSQWSNDPRAVEARKMVVYDLPFNASLVLALEAYAELLSAAGDAGRASLMIAEADGVRAAAGRVFKSPDGCYHSFRGPVYDGSPSEDRRISVLTQALCVLAGLPATEKMLSLIAANGGDGSVPATLSMACFRYDALLATDAAKYTDVVLGEIDRDCGYMLDRGATTFWETIEGEADFDGAGSLCHGWSAMAAYYYRRLLPV